MTKVWFALAAAALPAVLIVVPSVSGAGIYNSSITPAGLPWNTYNYCNAPHVDAKHYVMPEAKDVELVYLNAVMRHHKRTPDNLYPDENALNPAEGWDCTDFLQFNYGADGTKASKYETANVYHETENPTQHPFRSLIWNGTCDQGQLTRGGLDDSVKHGKDFWDVYHKKLGLLNKVGEGRDEDELYIRTSTETRTFQVAGGMLYGMDPSRGGKPFKVHNQPNTIDSLVPRYSCPGADAIRNAYQSVPAWTEHLQQNADLKARLDAALGTGGLGGWASWYDHFFDTFASRTCHGHPLPCNSTGACVSQEDGDRVFALGDFEYNYIWNAAENASTYVQLTYGVFFSELAANMRAFAAGTETYRARLHIGHDGSMIRLAAGLGFGKTAPLHWPALGSEVVMEVWKSKADKKHYVRVMHEGSPVKALRWVELGQFIELLDAQVPANIMQRCLQG